MKIVLQFTATLAARALRTRIHSPEDLPSIDATKNFEPHVTVGGTCSTRWSQWMYIFCGTLAHSAPLNTDKGLELVILVFLFSQDVANVIMIIVNDKIDLAIL